MPIWWLLSRQSLIIVGEARYLKVPGGHVGSCVFGGCRGKRHLDGIPRHFMAVVRTFFPFVSWGPVMIYPRPWHLFPTNVNWKLLCWLFFLLGFGFLFFYRVFKAITKLPPLIIAMDFFLPWRIETKNCMPFLHSCNWWYAPRAYRILCTGHGALPLHLKSMRCLTAKSRTRGKKLGRKMILNSKRVGSFMKNFHVLQI